MKAAADGGTIPMIRPPAAAAIHNFACLLQRLLGNRAGHAIANCFAHAIDSGGQFLRIGACLWPVVLILIGPPMLILDGLGMDQTCNFLKL